MKKSVTREKEILTLPVLPLKNVVLLPLAVLPVKVSRTISINAVNESLKHFGGSIFVTIQNNPDLDELGIDNFNTIGVVARIIESFPEKDSSLKILVEGLYRVKSGLITKKQAEIEEESYFSATLYPFVAENNESDSEKEAFLRNLKSVFKEHAAIGGERIAANLLKSIREQSDLESLVDQMVINVEMDELDKKIVLEETSILARAEKVYCFFAGEIEIAKAEKNIRKRVQTQVEKHQKDYYLNEQVRAIYKEMGKEDFLLECEKFKDQGKKLKLSKEAYEKLVTECKRLEQMQSTSPEVIVSRSYIEWLLSVPWHKKDKDQVSLDDAEKILESTHAGMKKVKESILDFVVAKKFAKDKLQSAPVICLVGPPGVGKTSLAKSIAAALGRVFVRISLGGLRDEAEIRGHRRTYIGAMPGKLIMAMKKAQVLNPVILLDEIDKMASDFRGDPASALLEVLDPEQNKLFMDHFLETGYDLSQVVFIATANMYENIPYPLLDRMEVIHLSGYTEVEKKQIAEKFLIPNLLKEHAIKEDQVSISSVVINKVIMEYTREAGVRQLNRSLLKLIRKTVYELLKSSKAKLSISAADVEKSLGYPKFKPMALEKKESIGIVIGLAWTEVGGDILEIEIVKAKGKGGLTITGQLGEVMQESAQAALSYIRSRAKEMGIKEDFYSEYDLHLHVPEGATPKEGPSAGAAISVALASILTEIPVNNSLAMTGEISLQGRVLAIGGIKDKLLAADRFGIKTVLVPKENEPEVNEIKKELSFNAEIIFVQTIDEVFRRALVRPIFIEPVTSIKPVVRKKIIKKEVGIALSVKSSKTKIKAAQKVQKQK